MDFLFPILRRSLPRRPGNPPAAARWLVPPAALVAISGLAALQADPAAAAESRFLALLVTGVLAAVAALEARVLGWTALLATAACWIAYHGPSRGAVVTLILAGGLGAAGGRAFARRDRRLDPGLTVPAAVALQLVLRSDLLLPPLLDLRTLVSVLALPAAAGCAVSLLAARFGGSRALVAGGAAAVLAPGWNVTSTLGLVALAAGAVLADRERPRAVRGLAALALALPLAWNALLGAILGLAGLALWAGPRQRSAGRSAAATAAVLLAGAAIVFLGSTVFRGSGAGGWAGPLAVWASGLVILPALVLAPADGRWRAVQGLALALLAAKLAPRPEALAAGLALAALGVPAAGVPAAGAPCAAARLQHAWSGVLLAGTAILAGYPWMRAAPRADLMALVGLGDGLFAPALLAAAVAAAAPLLDLAARRAADRRAAGRRPPAPELAVLLAVGVALLPATGPTAVVVDSYRAVALDGQRRQWRAELPQREISTLVLDTNLVHGAQLEPGAPVAAVELFDDGGRRLESWELRAGVDTAEWAAARPDVAARPGFVAPPPWISRLAPDGSFFARRFRSRRSPAVATRAAAIAITAAPQLPPEVRLVIYRLELR